MNHRRPESTKALRRCFEWLESKYGGLVMDKGAAAEIIQGDRIETSHLVRLFQHQACALQVKQFYPLQAASDLGRELAAQASAGKARNWKVSTSRGLESSDVLTLGEHAPFNVVAGCNDSSSRDDYFDGVLQEFNSRRFKRRILEECSGDQAGCSVLEPQPLWPLDLLRLQLDEVWPSGAGLAHETTTSMREPAGRRPFSGGLPRIMIGPTRWKRGFIHVDEMGPLAARQGLFSANVYLQLPENTSKIEESPAKQELATEVLHIWPLGIRSRWDWYRNALLLSCLSSQDAEGQIRLWNELGPPLTVAVEPGDLVLLCVQRPHAAIGFARGTRVSLQCFIQHSGLDQRLLIDS